MGNMDMIDFLEPMYRHFLLTKFGKTEKEMRKEMKSDGKSDKIIDEHMNKIYENFVISAVKQGGV